jgi:hypothetical protein
MFNGRVYHTLIISNISLHCARVKSHMQRSTNISRVNSLSTPMGLARSDEFLRDNENAGAYLSMLGVNVDI